MSESIGHHTSLRELPAFAQRPWQMSYGERTVLEGMLCMVEPRLSIEIGRAEGGSLTRIAAHSEQVLSLDIVEAPPEISGLANVRALAGDSHAMLPIELERIAGEGRNVDFVLVDGDHTAEGVRRDMQDLLESEALTNTVILAHDTLNEEVRLGLSQVDYDRHDKVAWVDLDFVPGYTARIPERLGECWGGLGLIVVDSAGSFSPPGARRATDFFDQSKLVWPAAQWVRSAGEDAAEQLDGITLVADQLLEQTQRQLAAVNEELERHKAWLNGIQGSISWRMTAPLRHLKRRLRGR